jgi:hypothetical protein
VDEYTNESLSMVLDDASDIKSRFKRYRVTAGRHENDSFPQGKCVIVIRIIEYFQLQFKIFQGCEPIDFPLHHVTSRRRLNRVFPPSLLSLLHRRNPILPLAPTMPPLHIKTVTLDTFKDVLLRYPAMVPEKLRDLDAQRYDTIPAAVAAQEEGEKHLTKDQVEKLVEWKLYVLPSSIAIACEGS